MRGVLGSRQPSLTSDELKKLGDPIATRVLLAGCPQKLDGIIASLNKASDCNGSTIATQLVSDRSELLPKPDVYRGVMTQDCTGGTNHDLFVSIFGITATASTLPQDGIEVIGHDKSNGVFNFYVNEGGWKFMGSSKDAVSDGYNCGPNGDCEPKAASKARCWACHEGGGLNMKELLTPWNSWDVDNVISGEQVFNKFPALGRRHAGSELEPRIEGANSEWDAKRVGILKAKGLEEVLRPVFCTLTVNIESKGLAGNVNFIPADFFVEGLGSSKGLVVIDNSAYQSALKRNGQKFVDRNGRRVGTANESPNGFLYVSKGDVDRRYIQELVAANVIDQDFVDDVMHVDFTRPVFSPTRCALASTAPKVAVSDMTPQKIRDGFKTTLAASSLAGAAQLLKNVSNASDAAAHKRTVAAFFKACEARPGADFVNDILQYNAHLKAAAKNHRANTPQGPQGIIEFSETFPVDDLQDTNNAFDPTSCTLK